MTINTFDKLRINLDANNNNSDSYFEIGHNTTATANSIFRVLEDGRVGIGDITPSYKLDVAGDIRATASLKLSGTGTIFESTNTGVQTFKFTNDNLIGVNTLEIADPGENEGITWAGTGAKIFVSPLNSGTTDGYLRVINDGGISFEGGSEDREDLLIASDGNVGIGTTTPDHKLSVTGRINASTSEANEASESIQMWHTTQEGNIGTSSGELRIRKGEADYLSFKESTTGSSWLQSHSKNRWWYWIGD